MAPSASTAPTRVCTDCGKEKPVAGFHGKGKAVDGTPKYQSYCRPCANKRRMLRGDKPETRRRKEQGYRGRNREKLALKAAERRERDPEAARQYEADRHLMKKYGITREEWWEMIDSQLGLCAICLRQLDTTLRERGAPGHKTCVDHCHKTGEVRAILCDPCNKGLGAFGDDIHRLQLAVRFLETHDKERPS